MPQRSFDIAVIAIGTRWTLSSRFCAVTTISPIPSPETVIIAVHGGGWQRGDRTLYRHWGPYVSTRGYAMMAIEYRIGPKTYPQAIGDVRAAVQYVRAHASELGIDRDRIILMGDSAGAHLAAMVALTAHEARFQSLYADDPNSKESVEISSAILVYGIYDVAAA